MSKKMKYYTVAFLALIALLGACSNPATATAPPTPLPSSSNGETSGSTESPATEEVKPAAIVNGEVIPMSMYLASVERYNAGLLQVGTILATEDSSQRIFEDLIFRQLLSQAAREGGLEF